MTTRTIHTKKFLKVAGGPPSAFAFAFTSLASFHCCLLPLLFVLELSTGASATFAVFASTESSDDPAILNRKQNYNLESLDEKKKKKKKEAITSKHFAQDKQVETERPDAEKSVAYCFNDPTPVDGSRLMIYPSCTRHSTQNLAESGESPTADLVRTACWLGGFANWWPVSRSVCLEYAYRITVTVMWKCWFSRCAVMMV